MCDFHAATSNVTYGFDEAGQELLDALHDNFVNGIHAKYDSDDDRQLSGMYKQVASMTIILVFNLPNCRIGRLVLNKIFLSIPLA